MRRFVLAVLALVSMLTACAPTPPVATLAAGPAGRIHFRSLSLTAENFAAGVKEGAPVTLSGELMLPRGSGRVPAVVLLHGSGGITGAETGWARELVDLGVATFLVDSFTGRGITGWPSEKQLSRIGGVIDAYRALELLATHPRIDPGRIGLMGHSRGGGLTVLAALDRFRRPWLPEGVDFALYTPFYPNYRNTYAVDTGVSRSPIRVFHGSADDANPIAESRAYIERLRRAGADARLFEYEGAHHSFDDRSLARIQQARGFTFGHDPRAYARAIQDVRATLTAVFALGS